MAEAPQVAYAHADLEHAGTPSLPPYPPQKQDINHPEHFESGQPTSSNILGMRKRNFWILLGLAIVIVAATVGGSIGGSLAVRRQESSPNAATPTASPTTSSMSIATSSGSSTATPSQTSSGALYTPLSPTSVPLIDNSCPPGLNAFSGRDEYSCYGGRESLKYDVGGLVAYTLQQCIDACSTMNHLLGNITCKGINLGNDLANSYLGNSRANCLLKSNTDNMVELGTNRITVAALDGTS